MHHDYLMIMSHAGAITTPILRGLTTSAEISTNVTSFVYTTPEDLYSLKNISKYHYSSRILADVILKNHAIRSMVFNEICMFIYYLSDPRRMITNLVQSQGYTPIKALDYYSFRLQRMSQMSRLTPKAILLTCDDLESKITTDKLSAFLRLKKPVYFSVEGDDLQHPPAEGHIADKACLIYDKYLSKLQQSLENQSHVFTADQIA